MITIVPLWVLAQAPVYDHAEDLRPAGVRATDLGLVAPRVAASGGHTIFLAMDGVTVMGGTWQDDASQNATVFPDLGGEWPPFGEAPGSVARQAVLDAVRADYAPYGVTITDERPTQGLYTMIVVSPRGSGTSQLGVANVGCGGWNLAGVGFAFFGAGNDPIKIASTVSHEAGHTLGLEHTDDAAAMMHATYQGGDPTFVAGCRGLSDPMIFCADVHAQHCPPGQQDSHAELLAIFGTGEVDTQGPAVVISGPVDGDRFDLGVSIDVLVDASDATGVTQVKLWASDKLIGTDIAPPYAWTLADLPEGTYTLRAKATDAAGNAAEAPEVVFAIGDAPLPGDGDDADEDDADAPAWPDPGDAAIDTERADSGCRIGASSPREEWSAMLLVLLLGMRRRVASKRRQRLVRPATNRSISASVARSASGSRA